MALQSYKDALHTKQRRSLLLTNCRVIDVEAGQELGGEGALHQVLINADGTIGSISPMAGGVPQLSPESVIVDCEGLWLLPGRWVWEYTTQPAAQDAYPGSSAGAGGGKEQSTLLIQWQLHCGVDASLAAPRCVATAGVWDAVKGH
jgi:hypothetical protein